MIIRNLRSEAQGREPAISATVVWEETDRPELDLYFRTSERFAADLRPNPEAFLVAAAPAAARHGERRVRVEGDVCPTLVRGLREALTLLSVWHRQGRPIPAIEARPHTRCRPPSRRTAAFLSGGVDSLATLAGNRIDIPRSHPASVRDGILVKGFDIGGEGEHDEAGAAAAFEQAMAALSAIADADGDLELIPVSTNLRKLDPEWTFWCHEQHGAALASVSHALAGRFDRVLIASTCDFETLLPWGSHPTLDPYYGSQDLRVLHDGASLSRLEKVQLVASRPAFRDHLRVCTKPLDGGLNCGKCEKCVRTKLELLALGVLDQSRAFAEDDVEARDVTALKATARYKVACYSEVLPLLDAMGRADLTGPIRHTIEGYEGYSRFGLGGEGVYELVELDRRFVRDPKALARLLLGIGRLKLRKLKHRLSR